MNIYTEIEEGQTLENNFTGNQFGVVKVQDEFITLERGGEFFTYTENEIRSKFEFYFSYEY